MWGVHCEPLITLLVVLNLLVPVQGDWEADAYLSVHTDRLTTAANSNDAATIRSILRGPPALPTSPLTPTPSTRMRTGNGKAASRLTLATQPDSFFAFPLPLLPVSADSSVNVDATDALGRTPLHIAAVCLHPALHGCVRVHTQFDCSC